MHIKMQPRSNEYLKGLHAQLCEMERNMENYVHLGLKPVFCYYINDGAILVILKIDNSKY